MENAIIFLCTENELDRERNGYFKAFSKQINTVCIPYERQYLSNQLEELVPENINPLLIIHPDSWPRLLPQGITTTTHPTCCFQIDTFEEPQARAEFSRLFDYAFVFHPEYDKKFAQYGSLNTYVLPHAVDAEIFQNCQIEKIYDLGWVGRLNGKKYSVRRYYINKLKRSFKMNDIELYYTPEEMALVYCQSKIVVNLSRDDYLQDANLRCFEVMASGALLITPKPSELSKLGFEVGIHFVSFEDELELYQKVQHYLEQDRERETIARNAQKLVLEQHTYDARVATILAILNRNANKLFAPARQWNEVQVYQEYLKYFCRSFMLDKAFCELGKIYKIKPTMAYFNSLKLIKALIIKFRDALR